MNSVIKSIFIPTKEFTRVYKIEQAFKNSLSIFLLIIGSLIISLVGAYYGLGTEQYTKYLGDVSTKELEGMKLAFGVGQVIKGILVPLLFIFLVAGITKLFFRETEFWFLLFINICVYCIFFLSQLIHLPIEYAFGITQTSSPFGFGVIAQYVTSNRFVIHLLSTISIFSIWAIIVQYFGIKAGTTRSNFFVLSFVIGLNVILFLTISVLSTFTIDLFF